MRYMNCVVCGKEFSEDDGNPNIHYSNPATICDRCISFNNKQIGDWCQMSNGEYYQKGEGDKCRR